MKLTIDFKDWTYKISSSVFRKIGRTLRAIWLVLSHLLGLLYQIGMQKSIKIVCMLFKNSFFFLLNNTDSEQIY